MGLDPVGKYNGGRLWQRQRMPVNLRLAVRYDSLSRIEELDSGLIITSFGRRVQWCAGSRFADK